MIEDLKIERSNITKSAFKVMAGGGFSLVAGLVNQIIIAAFFGARSAMDAYLTALVIPSYFWLVFSSALTFVLIPAFVREESAGREGDAWSLVGSFFWISAFILLIVSIMGSIFSGEIIAISAPGFSKEKAMLASKMLSILIFCLPFMAVGSLTVGIQNARNRFFWPSFAGAVNSLVNLCVILIFFHSLGPLALCWGFLIATISQAGFTIIPVIRHGWKRNLPITDSRVREVVKLAAPIFFSGLLVQSPTLIGRYFASDLPTGQLSYLGYAQKISGIFVSLLASGIAAAIFPSMARSFAENGLPGLAEKNNYGLRLTFAVASPAVMITSAISIPMVQLLFERGAFLHNDTLGVSRVIFATLLGSVLFRMIANINGRTSFVLKDTMMPSIIAAISVLIYIAIAKMFMLRWGYIGLAYAGALQGGINVLGVWLFLLPKMPKSHLSKTTGLLFQYFVFAFVAFLCGQFVTKLLSDASAGVQVFIGIAISLPVYFIILYLRDREILTAIFEMMGINFITKQIHNWRYKKEAN